MASSSSLGATSSANNEDAQRLYTTFNESIASLWQRIVSASSEEGLQSIRQDYVVLRQRLTDATPSLPKYDQELHEKNVRLLSEALTIRKEQIAPKKRFAFNRAAAGQERTAHSSTQPSDPPVATPSLPMSSNSSTDSTTHLQIEKKTNETIVLRPSSENGKSRDLHLKNLVKCKVDLRSLDGQSSWSALHLHNCVKCVVLAGRVDGSVMVHNDVNGTLVLGCKQFRLTNGVKTVVLISTTSIATIENGVKVRFGPATDLMLGKTEKLIEAAQVKVQDFQHVNTQQPSPNWSLMSVAEAQEVFDQVKF